MKIHFHFRANTERKLAYRTVHLVEILFPFSHKICSQGFRILTQAIPLLAPGVLTKIAQAKA